MNGSKKAMGVGQIKAFINDPKMDIFKAGDAKQGHYIVMEYYDHEECIFETHSIYTPRFGDMTLDEWKSEYESLIKIVKDAN